MRVFDIGARDGADTTYYLDSGYDVLAVDADPDFVSAFARPIAARRLTCLHGDSVTVTALCEEYGVPDYMKVGGDRPRLSILPLTRTMRPGYVSFDVGVDAPELVSHCYTIGYRRFRLVNQHTLRAAGRRDLIADRIAHGVMRLMGYGEPRMLYRRGRAFERGACAGPVPWLAGRWHSYRDTLARVYAMRTRCAERGAWYTIHAAVTE